MESSKERTDTTLDLSRWAKEAEEENKWIEKRMGRDTYTPLFGGIEGCLLVPAGRRVILELTWSRVSAIRSENAPTPRLDLKVAPTPNRKYRYIWEVKRL